MAAPKGAGELKDKVRFERRGDTTDEYGNPSSGGWADLGVERRCKLEPTKGDEAIVQGRLAGKASYDIWLRPSAAVKALKTGDRAVDARDAARVFNIRFGPADMTGDGKWLLVQAEAGVAT